MVESLGRAVLESSFQDLQAYNNFKIVKQVIVILPEKYLNYMIQISLKLSFLDKKISWSVAPACLPPKKFVRLHPVGKKLQLERVGLATSSQVVVELNRGGDCIAVSNCEYFT